jgi:DNA-binding NarL/FixJ family response regulator
MKVIGLTNGKNPENLLMAIAAKVDSLLPQDAPVKELYQSITEVAYGRRRYDQDLLDEIRKSLSNHKRPDVLAVDELLVFWRRDVG